MEIKVPPYRFTVDSFYRCLRKWARTRRSAFFLSISVVGSANLVFSWPFTVWAGNLGTPNSAKEDCAAKLSGPVVQRISLRGLDLIKPVNQKQLGKCVYASETLRLRFARVAILGYTGHEVGISAEYLYVVSALEKAYRILDGRLDQEFEFEGDPYWITPLEVMKIWGFLYETEWSPKTPVEQWNHLEELNGKIRELISAARAEPLSPKGIQSARSAISRVFDDYFGARPERFPSDWEPDGYITVADRAANVLNYIPRVRDSVLVGRRFWGKDFDVAGTPGRQLTLQQMLSAVEENIEQNNPVPLVYSHYETVADYRPHTLETWPWYHYLMPSSTAEPKELHRALIVGVNKNAENKIISVLIKDTRDFGPAHYNTENLIEMSVDYLEKYLISTELYFEKPK